MKILIEFHFFKFICAHAHTHTHTQLFFPDYLLHQCKSMLVLCFPAPRTICRKNPCGPAAPVDQHRAGIFAHRAYFSLHHDPMAGKSTGVALSLCRVLENDHTTLLLDFPSFSPCKLWINPCLYSSVLLFLYLSFLTCCTFICLYLSKG